MSRRYNNSHVLFIILCFCFNHFEHFIGIKKDLGTPKHLYKNKQYLNCGMNFTNRSLPILYFFKNKLEKFNFHPTQKTKFSIFLRREKEIIQYFQKIGSSNPKHLKKFKNYFKNKYGEVPKWS